MLQFSMLIFIFLLFNFCFASHNFAFPASQSLPPASGSEIRTSNDTFGIVSSSWWRTTRSSAAEGPAPAGTFAGSGGDLGGDGAAYMVLAPRRTRRKDPLEGFKYYTGGWNISERHYWASVGFSAAPLFIVSAAWFLMFGICLLIISLRRCCCRRHSFGYSRLAYVLALFFLVLFTLAAIIGCIMLYTGQRKFHRSTKATLEYIVNQADTTAWKLGNISDYLSTAKQIGVDKVGLPSNVQTDIDDIQTKINSSATTLSDTTMNNADDIADVLDATRLTLIIISAVMLLLTFLGFLFSMFGLQPLVYTLVVFGWILVTGTFILCGIFLLLHNVTADSCAAMHQWVENPTAHTSLDEILPCVDASTSQEMLTRSKEVTSQLVDLTNSVITNVSNINFGAQFAPFYYNQSGPLLPLLCNPFYHDFSDRPCSHGEVDLSNATQVWGNYVCEVSATGICTTPGRLTPTLYAQMGAAVNVSYGLLNFAPYLLSLQDCSFVRQTFTDIRNDYCPGLVRYSNSVYVGLVVVSVAVMLSLVFWVVYGRERKHRVYAKRLVRGGKGS